jgi:hypothetical protein
MSREKVQITLRYFISTSMALIKKTRVGQNVDKREHLHIFGEDVNNATITKKNYRISSKN